MGDINHANTPNSNLFYLSQAKIYKMLNDSLLTGYRQTLQVKNSIYAFKPDGDFLCVLRYKNPLKYETPRRFRFKNLSFHNYGLSNYKDERIVFTGGELKN